MLNGSGPTIETLKLRIGRDLREEEYEQIFSWCSVIQSLCVDEFRLKDMLSKNPRPMSRFDITGPLTRSLTRLPGLHTLELCCAPPSQGKKLVRIADKMRNMVRQLDDNSGPHNRDIILRCNSLRNFTWTVQEVLHDRKLLKSGHGSTQSLSFHLVERELEKCTERLWVEDGDKQ